MARRVRRGVLACRRALADTDDSEAPSRGCVYARAMRDVRRLWRWRCTRRELRLHAGRRRAFAGVRRLAGVGAAVAASFANMPNASRRAPRQRQQWRLRCPLLPQRRPTARSWRRCSTTSSAAASRTASRAEDPNVADRSACV